jgi:hypothetical protein
MRKSNNYRGYCLYNIYILNNNSMYFKLDGHYNYGYLFVFNRK